MYLSIKFKPLIAIILVFVLFTVSISAFALSENKKALQVFENSETESPESPEAPQKKYIKYVEFNATYSAMNAALKFDIDSQNAEIKLNWIELLSYLAAKYGGKFDNYKEKDLQALAARLKNGEKMPDITKDMKYYKFYYEAYDAVLHDFVGTYRIQVKNADGNIEWQTKYGLKVFSPIAKGYGYSHYDDFGNSRSFGYKRVHLGNDILGSIGTPIIAVESGTIEAIGWNMYGGWRIGIRSFDQKRYYYYAHMRKGHPFVGGLHVGSTVKAGDVIGYLGMTGYSTKEDKNNISVPHLHFGIQLIFDDSQKEGVNQIWIDVYGIVNLLQKNRSSVVKDESSKEYRRVYQIQDIQS